MKLSEVRDILQAEVLTGDERLSDEVELAFGSDLMSDVLAFVDEKLLLLTGLTNPQSIRTAEMLDLLAIVFVRGKRPAQETIDLAKKKGFILLLTGFTMYESCGRLYQAGLGALDLKQTNDEKKPQEETN